jgi:uncharacterized protein (DUF58 family)
MVPARRFLILMTGALVVAALPVVLQPELWPVVIGVWLLFGVACGVDCGFLHRARPTLEADVPAAAGVGDPVQVPVRIGLRGDRPLGATLRSEVEPPLEGGEDVRATLPGGASEHMLPVRADRRGEAHVRAAWLRLDGPLGLFQRIDRFALDQAPVRVLPNFARVRNLAIQHFGAWQYRGGLRMERLPGDGSEFDTLEAYSTGMDLRSVDWKASARHQALRVRRYRLERNQRVIVCLDTGRLMADPLEGLQRLDHGVHAALLVAYAALHGGDLVGLHAYGAEPSGWLPPASGVGHIKRLTQACSRLHPADEETNHVRGMHDLLRRMRRRSLVIVFTDFSDSTTAELMVEQLGHLARKHLVIFVALDDPSTETPLSKHPESTEDMAGAVVAGQLRQDRQRVLRRLRRMGVDVVHGPPGRAAVDLLVRYVRYKRRGLIG